MKKYILLTLIICSIDTILPQNISVKVKNLDDGKIALSSLQGEKVTFVDSISSDKKEEFYFSLKDKHVGFYHLQFSKNKSLDFVYDNEDIELETDANNIFDSIKVLTSESNKIYYEFIKLNRAYKTKTELLQLILARYPQDDNYYQTTKDKLIQIQEDYLYFVNVTAQVNPNSFIARYVRSAQLPVVDVEIPAEQQLPCLKTHALDNINFYDDGLIYSDCLTNKTIEYLTYYRNPQLPLELLEKEFMVAIDTILSKAKVNEIVYTHIVEYMLDGFKKFGFDNVINYIVENYIIKDDLCIDEKLGNTIERRIQQARNFKIGSTVPNIILQDSSGEMIDLSQIKSVNILILFYASWCPHCQKLIPQIYDFYKHQEEMKFEVLAISIDTVRTDWLNYIRANNLDWLNVSDLKGWEGKSVIDYFIYATPTMFLVDKGRKLIRIPKTIEDIKQFMLNK